jgi:hypothetical protein
VGAKQREGTDPLAAAGGLVAPLLEVGYAFTARPGRKPLRQLGATSTGAEHTQLCEHRSAGATTLTERISAGACSQQPVNGYERFMRVSNAT